MATEEIDELKKTATRGRGKAAKQRNGEWLDAFKSIIHSDPLGKVVRAERNGGPRIETHPATKKDAWVFEIMPKDQTEWSFSCVLNIDKREEAVQFTHTLPWCMEHLRQEMDLFIKGTYDKCRTRLRNLVSDDFIPIAILI